MGGASRPRAGAEYGTAGNFDHHDKLTYQYQPQVRRRTCQQSTRGPLGSARASALGRRCRTE